jgi:predicted DCC family thiol-disulfide oxidoreductase YuxK
LSLLRDWDRFWFKKISCAPVALMRICIGLLVIYAALQLWPDRFVWFSEHGLLPLSTAFAYNDVYTPGPRPINFLQYAHQDWMISAFLIVYMAAAALMTIGLWTRPAIFLVWIGLNCIHNRDSLNNTTGGDEVMLIMTAFLFMARSNGAISVDRLIRVWRGKEPADRAPDMSIWPQRLMQIQVSVVYLATFMNKTLGDKWQNGTAVYYPYQTLEFHRFPMPFMDANFHPHFPIALMNDTNVGMITLMTYGTLAIELALGTLVWVPRLRLYVLTAGILLHVGIEYAMNIPLFGFLMAASYISFLNEGDLRRFSAYLVRTLRISRLRVVYDGQCDFCRSAMLLLSSTDSFRRLRFLDYHRADQLAEVPGLAFEDADEAVVAVRVPQSTRTGTRRRLLENDDWPIADSHAKHYAGFRAFRQMALRLPGLWPVVPFMCLPGAALIGSTLYAWVAANRRRLPVAPALRNIRQDIAKSAKRPKADAR